MIVMQAYSALKVCGKIKYTITFHEGTKMFICRHLAVSIGYCSEQLVPEICC